jgi:hypothetical protein
MKLLLDENLPHELRRLLPGHDVFTVKYMGWSGISNGALLATAAADGFDALITLDSGVPYQQNLTTLPISVVVLSAASNDIDDLRPMIAQLLSVLVALPPKTVMRVP